jgi:hypothetical protein
MMMHKNHLPFIPEQYRCYQHYCKPSKEVLDAEKKDQKERSQYKKMKRQQNVKWWHNEGGADENNIALTTATQNTVASLLHLHKQYIDNISYYSLGKKRRVVILFPCFRKPEN